MTKQTALILTHNTLIPEAPILIYPTLAATIGLEEATLLATLTQYARHTQGAPNNGYHWFELDGVQLNNLAPFWQAVDIQRICANLREQGLIIVASGPFTQSNRLKFAFNERDNSSNKTHNTHARATANAHQPLQTHTHTAHEPMQAAPKPQVMHPSPQPHKNYIAPAWSPDKDTMARLAQLCVPGQFAMDQVPEFVNYWRERGEPAHAWGSKFMQHVIRKWRDFEAEEYKRSKNSPIHKNWQPSEDALNVLVHHAGISRQFVEDAVPEFVLYWRERGDAFDNWNKKFRDHVQRQWVRYRSTLEHDTNPKRIPPNWQPSADVFEVLRLANIDVPFAQQLLPEFVIYWRDSNQVHSSWNTRFLQYVKQRWARRDMGSAQNNSTSPPQTTRDISLAEQLTDRSWAL